MWGTGKRRKDTGGWKSTEHEVANPDHQATVLVKRFLGFLVTLEGVDLAQKSSAFVDCDLEIEATEVCAASCV